ncbi:hypothetical protein H632_c1688p0 [Helicosporidium sp. ATCC 50920]|nr:hypothetical protein H632_c1688p0 [Helicosporidium sp. ATCC 50920]|eukprot:KDD73969.1 hypothetical protein H632_c1688p0 [Helicosporidium sp. ATCC 50920]
MVLQELKRSDDSTKVYKVIGPALVPQDMFEATSNVEKRLEYIGNEISRLDAQLKSNEDKQAKKRQGIERMQQEFQSLQESIAAA